MSYPRIVLTAGFAMFSMFFGSGNLVFPILLGTQVMDMSFFATLGFVITAVFVPFLGLLGMIFYDGDTDKYFKGLGKIPSFLLVLIILSLLGPFGVVPRCITVAYGGLTVLYSGLSYPLFSFIFCVLITILIWKNNKVVDVIGLLLTPFKLGGLLFLLGMGLYYAPQASVSAYNASGAFTHGLHMGYHTMDLMAAFFFSATTVQYLRSHLHPGHERPHLFRLSLLAILIGAVLLSIAYVGFVSLGAKYALSLTNVSPESLLVVISQKTLGNIALPIIGCTMVVACLATSVILSILFVEFFQKKIACHYLTLKQSILLSMTVTFFMSLLGFQKIFIILGTILETTYPALIGLAIGNIIDTVWKKNWGRYLFWITLLLTIVKLFA